MSIVILAGCASSGPTTMAPNAAVAGAAVTPTLDTPAPAAPTPAGAASPTTAPAFPPARSTPETEATAEPADVPIPLVDTQLELSRYTARAGELLSLRAQGFAPGEPVHLSFAASEAVGAGELQANERGEVVAEALRIPALDEGQYRLLATGTTSGREVERTVSVIGFHPWVVLSGYAPHPGESFGFNGADFVPDEEVQIFLDGAESALATVRADDRGNLELQTLVTATASAVGKHNLEFIGAQSGARLPVAFEVLPFVPRMELSSYAGPPGTVLSFDGRGFAPGETVHAYLEQDEGRQELASFEADRDGTFVRAGRLVIPAEASQDTLTVVLEGEESRVPVSQRFGVLPINTWAGLSAYSGPPGTQITFRGKGFAAGETVDVFMGGAGGGTPVASVVADGNGEFESGLWALPESARGTTTFSFRGQNSKGESAAQFFVVGDE